MKSLLKISAISAVAVLGIALLAVPAMAHEGEDHARHHEVTQRNEEHRAEQQEAKERRQGKLDDARKRVCEGRLQNIQRIINKAALQGQKHLEVFNKIAVRVQEFYKNKGLSVDNYDTLVATVEAKRAAAQAAIAAVKSDTQVDCSGENPVGTADAFRNNIQAMHKALKEYRTAIKDLLVAVKSANASREGSQQ